MRDRFLQWLAEFDDELNEENLRRFKEGEAGVSKSEIKIMGQIGLVLSVVDVGLNSTSDFDAMFRGDSSVITLLKNFLLRHHLVFDDDGELIQMPKDTQWRLFYEGKWIGVYIADPLSIIKSKAQFKRLKDKIQLKKIFNRHSDWRDEVLNSGISLEWLDE